MTGVGNQASDGCSEPAFSPAVRWFGLLGLVGLVAFASSLIVLHLTSSNIDLMDHYVSNLANQPLGWVFMAGAFVHGWGNLALTLGLRAALNPGGLRTWAVLLFGLAALGILLAAVFPIDAPDQVPGVSGRIHRSAASATFALELAALFVFSSAFGRDRRWRRQRVVSLVLAVCATVAIISFVIAIQLDVAPGLAERIAMLVLLVWEIWVSIQLIRTGRRV